MLRNSIKTEIDTVLRPNQNGFRQSRYIMGQVITVSRIIKGVKYNNLEACIIFVDFTKAFDSIDRGTMSKILRSYGIPIEIINAIMILYNNT